MSGGAHIALAEAREAVVSHAVRLPSETVPLSAAAGRVLAEPFTAATSLPPFDNSAMDGFALRAADTAGAGAQPARLELAGESRAGRPSQGALAPGTAIRISTGAAMPDGADAVLRVEDAVVDGETLVVSAPVAPGADVRPAGDDIHAGQAVLPAGLRLGAGELAMATAAGATNLEVTRRPRVNIVATGDELVPAGEVLGPGQIHDSNSGMLAALAAERAAAVGSVAARVADTPEAVEQALRAGFEDADALVVCGGVSVGEHDHVKPALARAGVRELFWQVALRPGHPTWFGSLERAGRPPLLVFGLPGNPVSAYVTFELFAAPALRALEGDARRPLRLTARYSGPPVHKRAGFAQVLRCRLSGDGDELVAHLTAANQKSHALASLVGADCLGFVAEDVTTLEDGDRLLVELPAGQYT